MSKLKNLLALKGTKIIPKTEQKLLQETEVACKERGMCSEYGEHCAEMACKEIPVFEI